MVATHVDRDNGRQADTEPVAASPADDDGAGVPDARPAAGGGDLARSRVEAAAVGGAVVAGLAFVAAIFAVGLAARAVTEVRDDGGSTSGSSAAASAPAEGAGSAGSVGLADFSIDPGELDLSAGGVVEIDNQGAVTHNLNVDGTASEMIDPGGTAELDLSGLEPGTYDMWCDVPGHKEAGMKGTVTIS